MQSVCDEAVFAGLKVRVEQQLHTCCLCFLHTITHPPIVLKYYYFVTLIFPPAEQRALVPVRLLDLIN